MITNMIQAKIRKNRPFPKGADVVSSLLLLGYSYIPVVSLKIPDANPPDVETGNDPDNPRRSRDRGEMGSIFSASIVCIQTKSILWPFVGKLDA